MAKVSFEQRVERRNRLIGLLRSEGHWKTSDLREHLGISQRTLMRELAELRDAGYGGFQGSCRLKLIFMPPYSF